MKNIEIDNINMNDYPDFVDAYIIYAEDDNGIPLTDAELDQLNDSGFVNEYIHENQLYVRG